LGQNQKLIDFIRNRNRDRDKSYQRVHNVISRIKNEALKKILHEYKSMRNLAAHTYQLVSVDFANSFILRTFENIQRLELIINPF
jgi:hypothetical protein